MASHRNIFSADLRRPEYVAEVLDHLQFTACAGLMHFHGLVAQATSHIFDAAGRPIYRDVFLAIRSGRRTPLEIFERLAAKGCPIGVANEIAALWLHPVTPWAARAHLRMLKRFVTWQYRKKKLGRIAN